MLLLAGDVAREADVEGSLLRSGIVDEVHAHPAGIQLRFDLPRLDLNARNGLDLGQYLQKLVLRLVEVLRRVQVLHVAHREVQTVIGSEVLEVIVERELVLHLLSRQHGGLVRPAPGDVPERVSASAQHQHRHVEASNVLDAVRVTLHGEVEAPEPIARQRVRPALQHDGARREHLHDLPDDGTEDALVGLVVHPVVQREVDGVVLPVRVTDVVDVPGAREVLPELVKGARHDAVRRVEGLLDAVSVVDVDVDVQDPLVLLEELQYRQDAVVDVAEPGGLRLLGVVQPPGPVDDDVDRVVVETRRTADRPRGVQLAELEEAVEDRAVLPDVEPLELTDVILHVVGRDDLQEVDVIVGVKARHGRRGDQPWPKDLHLPIQTVVHHEVVGHANPVRFHRVALPVMVVADFGVIKIRNSSAFRHFYRII
mmetsp:Transcript_20578/g.48498  ORF Transcript_20578/g.48498 Transcript_20578/m.48498 type:complete len:426 (-) Transcript_20578:122-1399(-)